SILMTRCRSLISYLSIGILILNIGLANAVATNDDKILLCTSQGYSWVTLVEMNSKFSKSDISAIHKAFKSSKEPHHCPLCIHNKMDSDKVLQFFYGPKHYSSFYSARLKPSINQSSTDTLQLSFPQARAPPYQV
ncbi:MAG: hypothetical protein ACI80S_001935, partial [Pseudohongiellaceae bacterium]